LSNIERIKKKETFLLDILLPHPNSIIVMLKNQAIYTNMYTIFKYTRYTTVHLALLYSPMLHIVWG